MAFHPVCSSHFLHSGSSIWEVISSEVLLLHPVRNHYPGMLHIPPVRNYCPGNPPSDNYCLHNYCLLVIADHVADILAKSPVMH